MVTSFEVGIREGLERWVMMRNVSRCYAKMPHPPPAVRMTAARRVDAAHMDNAHLPVHGTDLWAYVMDGATVIEDRSDPLKWNVTCLPGDVFFTLRFVD